MVKIGVYWLIAVLSATTGQEDSTLFELNIIHYNDFHAHFDQVSAEGTVCVPEDGPCIGGFSRLYTAIMQSLEVEPDSLVLNGGDTFQGTVWYNFLRWNVSQHFMNMIPHDAHVLGNHEFDHGIEGLVPYLRLLESPMLGANVNSSLEPRMQGLYQNHTIVERHGRRIGIIGILLRQFSAPIGNLIIENEIEAVNREAAILTERGVDIIIVLSHCGYDNDQFIAARVVPEVDLIVGAHSHSLLYNGETPNGDDARGAYPTVVTQENGHTIPIVQASCYTRYLGNIKFFFDAEGKVQYWDGLPIYLGTSILQDARIEELLSPWRAQVEAISKEVLGTSRVSLSRSQCTGGECSLGSWACDGFINQLMHRAAGTSAWSHVHACLINAGGLRTSINSGNVTTEALLMAMPFENLVQVYELKGQYLLEALEFSVGTVQTPGQFYSSRMVQIGGMRVTYNASAAVGSRVVEASVRCIECEVPRYLPLNTSDLYRLVTQNYIGEGGSGFTMVSENRENVENLELDYVMLQRYLRDQKTVTQDLDGRITIVY